ncbi:MAG: MBL fold metallo-hydrolase [Phycisphaeraceae bacterium]
MDFRIISIGTLSVHELWQHQGPARTPHATTTLVTAGDRRILVDPGLPGEVVAARLAERSGLKPEDISDVFLTNFRPAHRAGLLAFPNARWLISEAERESIGPSLIEQFQRAEDDATRKLLQQEIALLKKCEPAPDQIAPQVDLFPLPGFTPGTCGLLLSHPRSTTLIAGDACATIEHLEHARVLRGAYDVDQAQESLKEALEIADVIIPGHDNVVLNPLQRRGTFSAPGC